MWVYRTLDMNRCWWAVPFPLLASLNHHYSRFVLACGTAAHHMAKRTWRISHLLLLPPRAKALLFLLHAFPLPVFRWRTHQAELPGRTLPSPSISYCGWFLFQQKSTKDTVWEETPLQKKCCDSCWAISCDLRALLWNCFIGLQWVYRSLTSFKT